MIRSFLHLRSCFCEGGRSWTEESRSLPSVLLFPTGTLLAPELLALTGFDLSNLTFIPHLPMTCGSLVRESDWWPKVVAGSIPDQRGEWLYTCTAEMPLNKALNPQPAPWVRQKWLPSQGCLCLLTTHGVFTASTVNNHNDANKELYYHSNGIKKCLFDQP